MKTLSIILVLCLCQQANAAPPEGYATNITLTPPALSHLAPTNMTWNDHDYAWLSTGIWDTAGNQIGAGWRISPSGSNGYHVEFLDMLGGPSEPFDVVIDPDSGSSVSTDAYGWSYETLSVERSVDTLSWCKGWVCGFFGFLLTIYPSLMRLIGVYSDEG